jgi:hypothetical protein
MISAQDTPPLKDMWEVQVQQPARLVQMSDGPIWIVLSSEHIYSRKIHPTKDLWDSDLVSRT